MQLPEIGSVVAIQYQRNPRVHSDPALDPRLYLGRVVRHEGSWGFTAALMNYDNPAQETWLEWDEEKQGWDDRNFQQPVEWVRFPVEGEMLTLFKELDSLPAELPVAEGGVRPFSEMRLRFIAGALEAGWFADTSSPRVFYSDDFSDPASNVARWHKQPLGRCEVESERIFFEWPIEGKPAEECGITLLKQPGGSYYAKSEEYGDEFEADLEERDGYRLLCGLWAGEEFLSFFGVVLPKS